MAQIVASVPRFERRDDGVIFFHLQVRPTPRSRFATVLHRYSEFAALFKNLQQKQLVPSAAAAIFPPKTFFALSEPALEARRGALDEFMRYIVGCDAVADTVVQTFLGLGVSGGVQECGNDGADSDTKDSNDTDSVAPAAADERATEESSTATGDDAGAVAADQVDGGGDDGADGEGKKSAAANSVGPAAADEGATDESSTAAGDDADTAAANQADGGGNNGADGEGKKIGPGTGQQMKQKTGAPTTMLPQATATGDTAAATPSITPEHPAKLDARHVTARVRGGSSSPRHVPELRRRVGRQTSPIAPQKPRLAPSTPEQAQAQAVTPASSPRAQGSGSRLAGNDWAWSGALVAVLLLTSRVWAAAAVALLVAFWESFKASLPEDTDAAVGDETSKSPRSASSSTLRGQRGRQRDMELEQPSLFDVDAESNSVLVGDAEASPGTLLQVLRVRDTALHVAEQEWLSQERLSTERQVNKAPGNLNYADEDASLQKGGSLPEEYLLTEADHKARRREWEREMELHASHSQEGLDKLSAASASVDGELVDLQGNRPRSLSSINADLSFPLPTF